MNAAWGRRRTAARKYQPARIRLLVIREAPPADESSYFYFEDADAADPLFEQVCAVLFEQPPADRVMALKELRKRGVFLLELKPDGVRKNEKLSGYVPPFLLNLESFAPEKIILIGREVSDALKPALEKAKQPVVDAVVPAPSTGDGVEFRQKLRQALVRADLEKLIRPIKPRKAKPDSKG